MKKHFAIFFFVSLSLFGKASLKAQMYTHHNTPESAPVGLSPDATIREFYRWYVHELNQKKDPRKESVIMKKYVTPNMVRFQKKYWDADAYLSAQDWDPGWEKAENINISHARVEGAKATSEVNLKGGEMSRHLKLTLIKDGETWKIDSVKGLDQ